VDDHRELMQVMGDLRRAADAGDDLGGLLDRLSALLARHTEREESGLFHVLHQVDIPEQYVGLFRHDHAHFDDLVRAAREDPAAAGALLDALDAHMAREEDDMFPAARQLLGPADWDAVEAAVAGLA
jgi:hemerythrin-like domain-containing protein